MKLVAGNSNRPLAEAIAAYLKTPLTKCIVRRFADMEIFVEVQENVRGEDVFVIQSTSAPANDHLMELLILIDALKRASARRITAVIPYFGYARQDRKPGPRTPISAKLVANMIDRAGADRVLTLDLHAGQIQGFFDIPTDNLFAAPVMVQDIKKVFDSNNLMVVSPDVGGVVRARGLAKRIDAPLAIVDKRRERPGDSEVMNVIGDVRGRTCILVDDIVDSGGTLVNAATALLDHGASLVTGYITHGVLSGGAVARIMASQLKELVITDFDPAERSGEERAQYPRADHRSAARRGDRADRRGAVGVEPVLLAWRRREPRPTGCGLPYPRHLPLVMALILEGDFDLGPVGFHLAVGDDEVLLEDLRHAQVAQGFGSALDRRLGGLLPGFRAGADQFDDFVHTLRHNLPP